MKILIVKPAPLREWAEILTSDPVFKIPSPEFHPYGKGPCFITIQLNWEYYAREASHYESSDSIKYTE